MFRSLSAAVATLALLALTLLAASPALSASVVTPTDVADSLPVGFTAVPFAEAPPGILPTSLAWGPSTAPADVLHHGTRLYVTAVTGNPFGGTDNGMVLAYEDEGHVPAVVISGLDQPLGVVMGPGKILYVSETEANHGRVTAFEDTNADGTFDAQRVVIRNLPNGRHQTNGMSFGPDGMLYVANGNATDDGLECGPALVPGGSEDDCPAAELQPWTGSILRVDPSWTDVDLLADVTIDSDTLPAADGLDDDSVLVATGFRNIYDVDFDPQRPSDIWTPMNGPDNPSGSEPLYGFDASVGGAIEDAGFPSCLYDPHFNAFPEPQVLGGHEHEGSPEPEDNPNREVTAAFGLCDADAVMLPKAIFTDGHEGTSGLAFTRGTNFPSAYAGDLFVAEWGSIWNLNGGKVTGHKVIHVDLDEQRNVVAQSEFLTGVLPMDVTFGPNGHMYVADMAGQIYDVSYAGI